MFKEPIAAFLFLAMSSLLAAPSAALAANSSGTLLALTTSVTALEEGFGFNIAVITLTPVIGPVDTRPFIERSIDVVLPDDFNTTYAEAAGLLFTQDAGVDVRISTSTATPSPKSLAVLVHSIESGYQPGQITTITVVPTSGNYTLDQNRDAPIHERRVRVLLPDSYNVSPFFEGQTLSVSFGPRLAAD